MPSCTSRRRAQRLPRALLSCLLLAGTPLLAQGLAFRELVLQPGEHAASLAADGTVVGTSVDDGVLRWPPEASSPEPLGGGPISYTSDVTPALSKNGRTIAVVRRTMQTPPAPIFAPWFRQDEGNWAPLPGLSLHDAFPYGVSADGTRIVGAGRMQPVPGQPAPNRPWIWDAAAGQRTLPVPVELEGGEAWAVGDDGRVAIGHFYYRPDPAFPNRYYYGARWSDGVASVLRDAEGRPLGRAMACNADCSIIVGGGPGGDVTPDDPAWALAWFWTEAGGATYLDPSGLPAGAQPPYTAWDLSDDGATIVGTYTILAEEPFGVLPARRPFLWTAAAGMRDLGTLLASQGIAFGGEGWELVASAVSPDGRQVLLNGRDTDSMPRAAVVTLPGDRLFGDGFDPGLPDR